MKLSPVVERYFDAWIRRRTWDSGHALDTANFYRFVKAVARYSRKPPSAADIYALILDRRGWKGPESGTIAETVQELLAERAKELLDLYQTLLDYEKTKGFPDPLIERTDIVKFYVKLRGTKDERDSRMREVWGSEWRKQYDEEMKRR